jgi:1,2-diacylglycerol 3-beta-glucosyltransferase
MVLALLAQLAAALLLGAGCLLLASSVYLLTLAVASFLHRPPERSSAAASRIAVLVPAHDEEEHIGRCLASLATQSYPRDLRSVIVVADNCTDRTADVARAHGADVWVREEPDDRGKGRAVRWALDRILDGDDPPDVIVMIDADSVADPDLLRHLEAELVSGGAVVAQADYRVLDASSAGSRLVSAGFLLFHRTRLSGRAALGLAANLVGNGMAFQRQVFERLPWSAFTSVEDLEYSLILRLGGVRPVFVPRALVLGPVPQGRGALRDQRVRWEGGRLYLLRAWIGRLVVGAAQRRDWSLLDAAIDLAILPLGLLVLVAGSGFAVTLVAVALGEVPAWVAYPWALAIVALPVYVLVGLRAAEAPAETYRALLAAPGFVIRKIFLYAGLARGVDPSRWEASRRRDGDDLLDPDGDGIAWISGVPVHVVDMGGAVDRVMDLVGRPEGGHVCTINLDFVVSAQRDPEVTGVLQRSSLNVADGAPVAWLARLLGHRMPRVAGADLVPLIASRAARDGIPLYFLGGEGQAAEESARRLTARFPGLRVAGCYEPPLASLDELPSADMVRSIRDSGAGIVLVGLGHPKQERWIARNREDLGSLVAIGVGGCFDFISARRRRAPRWLQETGLEWVFRLAQEPRRLFGRYARDAAWLLVLTPRVLRSRSQVVQARAGQS